jgi:LAS superfamily LD-carboxypeptidase LdcB
MNPSELTGIARTHIVALGASEMHRDVVDPFVRLRAAAALSGIDLQAVSAFRNFERQLLIWNGKFRGERPMFDADGAPLDALRLPPSERVAKILLWSALPGASRHHWGTDFDLIDAAAVSPGYRVQLSSAEFGCDGPFAALDAWLGEHAHRHGFFRPFCGIRSAVAFEPWHYSFAPIAEPARDALTVEVLGAALAGSEIEGKSIIFDQIEALHARFVATIDAPAQIELALRPAPANGPTTI